MGWERLGVEIVLGRGITLGRAVAMRLLSNQQRLIIWRSRRFGRHGGDDAGDEDHLVDERGIRNDISLVVDIGYQY